MSYKRAILAVIIGTILPSLAVLQGLTVVDLDSKEYWLGIIVLSVTSFSASLATVLTILADSLGIPLPKALQDEKPEEKVEE